MASSSRPPDRLKKLARVDRRLYLTHSLLFAAWLWGETIDGLDPDVG
jgi:hypothetical protein